MIDLNLLVVISLSVLAFFSFCLFIAMIPIIFQFYKTLSSLQRLLDTFNDDIEPLVKDFKNNVSNIKSKLDGAVILLKSSLSKAYVLALSGAYGILSSAKDYLCNYKNDNSSYNGKRGEELRIEN